MRHWQPCRLGRVLLREFAKESVAFLEKNRNGIYSKYHYRHSYYLYGNFLTFGAEFRVFVQERLLVQSRVFLALHQKTS